MPKVCTNEMEKKRFVYMLKVILNVTEETTIK
jgi:hypothetical protein